MHVPQAQVSNLKHMALCSRSGTLAQVLAHSETGISGWPGGRQSLSVALALAGTVR